MILSVLLRPDDSSVLDSLSWQLLQLAFNKMTAPDLCQMPSNLDPKDSYQVLDLKVLINKLLDNFV